MIETIDISDGKLILSTKDEYGYQEVLDDFSSSKDIIVITYSIHKDLLKKLYLLDSETRITIVTNIPARMETYRDNQHINAKKQIGITKAILNKDKFKGSVTTYFKFDNHCKILISDNLAYIGSQNFYGKSSCEAGVIIDDSKIIDKIRTKFTQYIIGESISYSYKNDFGYLDEVMEEIKSVNGSLKEKESEGIFEEYEVGYYPDIIHLEEYKVKSIGKIFLNVHRILSDNKKGSSKLMNYFVCCTRKFYSNLYIIDENYECINKKLNDEDIFNEYYEYINNILMNKNISCIEAKYDDICKLIEKLEYFEMEIEEYVIHYYDFIYNEQKTCKIDNTN